eukprot:6297976-Amphidinium_carterae.1
MEPCLRGRLTIEGESGPPETSAGGLATLFRESDIVLSLARLRCCCGSMCDSLVLPGILPGLCESNFPSGPPQIAPSQFSKS